MIQFWVLLWNTCWKWPLISVLPGLGLLAMGVVTYYKIRAGNKLGIKAGVIAKVFKGYGVNYHITVLFGCCNFKALAAKLNLVAGAQLSAALKGS